MSGIEEGALLAYLAAGSAVVGVATAAQSADTARKANHTKADTDRANAIEVSRQATDQIEGQRAKARSVIGSQLASTSESGTGLNGSNLDLLNQSLVNNASDSLALRFGSDRNSAGLNRQAGFDDFSADSAQTGGYLSAAGSLLNAGSSYTRAGTTVPNSSFTGYGGNH